MVYSDYSLGSSTRIDQIRSENPVYSRWTEAIGGTNTQVLSVLGLICPTIYFWRKFNQYSWVYRVPGTLFLAFNIKQMMNGLAVVNFGNLIELQNLQGSIKYVEEVVQVDMKKLEDEMLEQQVETIRKMNIKKTK